MSATAESQFSPRDRTAIASVRIGSRRSNIVIRLLGHNGQLPQPMDGGDVTLVDDDSGSAMFTVTNMKPSTPETECITVTYQGSLDASVRFYGALTAGDGL